MSEGLKFSTEESSEAKLLSGQARVVVSDLIQDCISKNVDPLEYAKEKNIDLSDFYIMHELITREIKNVDEYKIMSKLSNNGGCCTGNCSNNLCKATRISNSLRNFKSFNEKLFLLKDLENDKSVGPSKTRYKIVDILKELTESAETKEELQSLLTELENIKNTRDQDSTLKLKLDHYYKRAGLGFQSVNEYLDYIFEEDKKKILEKLSKIKD